LTSWLSSLDLLLSSKVLLAFYYSKAEKSLSSLAENVFSSISERFLSIESASSSLSFFISSSVFGILLGSASSASSLNAESETACSKSLFYYFDMVSVWISLYSDGDPFLRAEKS